MEEIWKYPLRVEDFQIVKMPAGARILTVQTQKGVPCLWALVHTGRTTEERGDPNCWYWTPSRRLRPQTLHRLISVV